MGWKDFLKPNSEKVFLFGLLFLFALIGIYFNASSIVYGDVDNALLSEGRRFAPPSPALLLVTAFAAAPVIIIIAYLMACMLASPGKLKKPIKRKTIVKRKTIKRKKAIKRNIKRKKRK